MNAAPGKRPIPKERFGMKLTRSVVPLAAHAGGATWAVNAIGGHQLLIAPGYFAPGTAGAGQCDEPNYSHTGMGYNQYSNQVTIVATDSGFDSCHIRDILSEWGSTHAMSMDTGREV